MTQILRETMNNSGCSFTLREGRGYRNSSQASWGTERNGSFMSSLSGCGREIIQNPISCIGPTRLLALVKQAKRSIWDEFSQEWEQRIAKIQGQDFKLRGDGKC